MIDVYRLYRLGWQHKIEIEEGVQKLFEWYKRSLEYRADRMALSARGLRRFRIKPVMRISRIYNE